jgi:hypothetical protein
MTPVATTNKRKAINLDNVTYAERSQWHLDGDPNKTLVEGVTVHFVGGSAVRLVGSEAAEIAEHFSLS